MIKYNGDKGFLKTIVVALSCFLFLQGFSWGENKVTNKGCKSNLIPQGNNTGVLVMRRFMRENSEGKILVSIAPISMKHKGITNIIIDDDQNTERIRNAIQDDCQSPDAALNTGGDLSLEMLYFTIQLDGDAYTILIGCDGAGLRIGQNQYRWKSPRLSKVLYGIFEKAGWMKGDMGKRLEKALNSMVTGGGLCDDSKTHVEKQKGE